MGALIWCALAWAGPLPVATHELAPGTVIAPADVRWVDVDSQVVQRDSWPDPVGRLVVERVLGGEPVRAERLLDPAKPERFAPPGLRAVRVPTGPGPDFRAEWVDLQVDDGGKGCALLAHVFVLGPGRGPDGGVDSWWVLMSPEHALEVMGEGRPMRLVAASQEATPCSP